MLSYKAHCLDKKNSLRCIAYPRFSYLLLKLRSRECLESEICFLQYLIAMILDCFKHTSMLSILQEGHSFWLQSLPNFLKTYSDALFVVYRVFGQTQSSLNLSYRHHEPFKSYKYMIGMISFSISRLHCDCTTLHNNISIKVLKYSCSYSAFVTRLVLLICVVGYFSYYENKIRVLKSPTTKLLIL